MSAGIAFYVDSVDEETSTFFDAENDTGITCDCVFVYLRSNINKSISFFAKFIC